MSTKTILLIIFVLLAVIIVGYIFGRPRTTTDLSGKPVADERKFFEEFKKSKQLTEDETEPTSDQLEQDEISTRGTDTNSQTQDTTEIPVLVTNGVKHIVPLADIRSGGPPKDGIPSIDNPKFVSVTEANTYLKDEGVGIAVDFNGDARFYPNQILVWHEIVNDEVGGRPVLISYCPLCGTGIVFEPLVNGKATEFGTSGKLWNSNLVMYDRQTDSYWSQLLGQAIVGEQAGTKLKLLPHQNIRYRDWKKEHPEGDVLSNDTGFFKNYTVDPYGDYYTTRGIIFPVDNEDNRYHQKALTYGLDLNGQFKVYPVEELQKGPSRFTDSFAGVDIEVTFNKANETVVLINKITGEEIVPFFGFWFAWIAAHPDSEVYIAG